ncbi:type IV pilus modification protein PilV [Dyella sp. M7H15-1]|uniref:type IV pilus modification protein PilV n=1 Tax=Dyella sp. M7H15-1 TaxID=2501295 RepID=UPI001004F375|nr:type IV pilus modification protein PilV [Dyella sp. M7H15-1]QAU24263.1 type IV pilus modification protein PilV [Dyella sp. M7H15-1]
MIKATLNKYHRRHQPCLSASLRSAVSIDSQSTFAVGPMACEQTGLVTAVILIQRCLNLASHRTRGFTLLEVLVALVILSIGLLGLAAMQASALSSTHGSQLESMVAIQARSLADAMSANPDYWANTSPTFTVTGTGSASDSSSGLTFTGSPPTYSGSCFNTICPTSADVAGYDVQLWANQLLLQVPGSKASIVCSASAPVGCSITITWTEKSAAAVNQGTTNASATTNMSYTLVNQI